MMQDQDSNRDIANLDVSEQHALADLVSENVCQHVKGRRDCHPSQHWIDHDKQAPELMPVAHETMVVISHGKMKWMI